MKNHRLSKTIRWAARNTGCLLLVAAILGLGEHRVLGIVNGEPDGEGHPNVGTIVIDHPTEGPQFRCTGTLVHPQVFLTAGHCTLLELKWRMAAGEFTINEVYVSFDQANPLNPSTWRRVIEIPTHPDFVFPPITVGHFPDLGALVLEEPATDLTPAVLAAPGFLDELRQSRQLRRGKNATKFTVVGYGTTTPLFPPNEFIYPGDGVRRVAQAEYLNLFLTWLGLLVNASAADGGISGGDSGGPVFWKDTGTGDETLVSIVSLINGVANSYTVRLDTPIAQSFINEVIDSLP